MHRSWRHPHRGHDPAALPLRGTFGPGRSAVADAPGDPGLTFMVEPTLPAVGAARAFIRRSTGGAVGGPGERAAVCGSELVANAVRHGAPPILLTVTMTQACILVTVEDASRVPPLPRIPGASEPGGRGTLIVARLADSWGVDFLPHGKRVWCAIGLAPS